MNNSKTIKLSLTPLLMFALAVVVSAQQPSPPGSSTNPSPALTSVQALITELQTPGNCPPGRDQTICVAEDAAARLNSASMALRSLTRIFTEQEGIIQTQERHLGVKDKIIADYQKLDVNNQRLDTNNVTIDRLAERNERLYLEQHRDDKEMIGDLQKDLASCRNNQKWIAGGSMLIGGVIGYKIRGAGTIQNPFQPNNSLFANGAQPPTFMNFTATPPTNAEENMRRALKTLNPPR